jgi:ligand-binding sensor domain-containing protein
MKTGLLLLCFFVFTSTMFGQSYSFKNYTTHDGLVQTDITDIAQDKKGNIWIGTNGGISIFDGKRFTNYDDHDLLQSLHINALLCDSSGIMWIATRNGLLKYKNSFEVFFMPNTAPDNPVTCLSTNTQNQLLFVCNNVVYEVKNNKVEKYSINNKIENNAALLSFDRDDNLWIVTTDLSIYKKSDNTVTSIRTPFTTEEKKEGLDIIKVLGKDGPAPYFVTNFGAFWVKDDSLHYFIDQYPQFRKTRVGQATYVLERDDSTVWVGGTMGLSKLSGASATRFAGGNGFCDNSVSCIFTDRENNLWVGCTYNGVYKLSNEALFHLNPSREFIDLRHISAIVPLSTKQTLLSTWGKGLFLYDGDSVSQVPLSKPYVRYITGLLPVGDHTYIGWFGRGLWKMNNRTFNLSLVPGFAKDEAVNKLFKVAGHLLVTTLDYSCYLTDYDLNIKASTKLPEDYTITILKEKIYRVSPFGEVDILDNKLKVVKKNIFPEISSRITEITCYRDNFLVGTFGQGLFVYNQRGKLVKRIDKKGGLNTNIITSLLVDGVYLFIGSNLGLIRADLPDLSNIKVFKESEGMFNWECRQDGLKKLPNGAIMIATTNGPYIYHPNKDMGGQYTAGVLTVADFRVGENPPKHYTFSSVSQNIQLPEPIEYNDNQVIITLNGVSQRNPDGIIYHYQLQGYDSMWVSTANPVIKINSLEPGDYKLRAYISIENFNSKQVSVKFSVAKPLSGKLWFQALLILFLSVLCWLLLTIGNRIYQKYIQSKMISKLEANIALKQQLTAQSISFTQQNYKELSDALKTTAQEKQLNYLTPLFLKDISNRIELLWKKDTISIGEFHRYFDELLPVSASGAKLYHKLSVESTEIPMPAAFHLLQLFSLYLFIGLHQNSAAVFSLDSEIKSNGNLLLRFYTVTHEAASTKSFTYYFLKEAIERQRHNGVTIDVIENLEFGNTLLAELNLHNA